MKAYFSGYLRLSTAISGREVIALNLNYPSYVASQPLSPAIAADLEPWYKYTIEVVALEWNYFVLFIKC